MAGCELERVAVGEMLLGLVAMSDFGLLAPLGLRARRRIAALAEERPVLLAVEEPSAEGPLAEEHFPWPVGSLEYLVVVGVVALVSAVAAGWSICRLLMQIVNIPKSNRHFKT